MKLLNRSEEATYGRLLDITTRHCAKVFPKVRIADVLPTGHSGLSSELFGFCLKAHFDFVVSDSQYEPLFAVEFDGPLHATSPEQRIRDEKKNRVCQHFDFPILRINSRYINRQYRGFDLLTYFIDVWFLAEAFYDAQQSGAVPYDELFDPCLIVSSSMEDMLSPNPLRDGGRFPYWLSLPVQIELQKLQKEGRIVDYVPSTWMGRDENQNLHCLSWLQVTEDSYLVARTGMRQQRFPVIESELLGQIAIFEIRREIDNLSANRAQAWKWKDLASVIDQYESSYRMACFSGTSRNVS